MRQKSDQCKEEMLKEEADKENGAGEENGWRKGTRKKIATSTAFKHLKLQCVSLSKINAFKSIWLCHR